MADKFDTAEIRNPKRTIERRMETAEEGPSRSGVDKGDIPGRNADFFKQRTDKSKAPPADMLKKHYGSK